MSVNDVERLKEAEKIIDFYKSLFDISIEDKEKGIVKIKYTLNYDKLYKEHYLHYILVHIPYKEDFNEIQELLETWRAYEKE